MLATTAPRTMPPTSPTGLTTMAVVEPLVPDGLGGDGHHQAH
ncbi:MULTISPECIES: hypothetical protein [Streptomyces]|nr:MULTISPECIES: hypothetical protein [Streptomyces]